MHFGFALGLSNVDFLNIDFLDTHLDLLNTDIPSKYFACLHNLFKTSWRHVFKTSSRLLQLKSFSFWKIVTSYVLEDVKLLRWRRIKDVFKTCLEDVLKTFSRPKNHCWGVVSYQNYPNNIFPSVTFD